MATKTEFYRNLPPKNPKEKISEKSKSSKFDVVLRGNKKEDAGIYQWVVYSFRKDLRGWYGFLFDKKQFRQSLGRKVICTSGARRVFWAT